MGEVSSIQSPKIQPIETFYQGCHFRSRLEARYAVVFDTIGLQYEYEPEGFESIDGSRYLPDFYLPDVRTYAEVKPSYNNPEEQKSHSIRAQCMAEAGMTDKLLFLLGQPRFTAYPMFRVALLPDGVQTWETNAILDIHFRPKTFREERRLYEDVLAEEFCRALDFSREYRLAVYRARAARFEERVSGLTPEVEAALRDAVKREELGGVA